jgi:serine phosphatase RsbU (regulator of sigma subunit)/GAF domain-containing protein
MLQSSDWELSTVAQISRVIAAAAHDPQELAEITFLEVARLAPADFFQLGVFDGDQYRTLIQVRDGNRVENLATILNQEQESIVGWIRRTGETLLVNDFQAEINQLPAKPSYQAEDPPTSGLFIPLSVANTTIGLLALQSRKPGSYTQEHVDLFNLLGHSLSAALLQYTYAQETEFLALHMVLVQEISHLLMSLEPLDQRLHQTVGLMVEVLQLDQVDIYEVNEEEIGLHTSSNSEQVNPIDGTVSSFINECATEGRTQILRSTTEESAEAIQYEYAIPLQVVDHLLGVLHLASSNPLDLDGEQGNILYMLANQLGFAILEARNYDERQEEAWMTTVLLEVAKHASQPGDTLSALQAVLQLATLLAGTDWAMLLLPVDDPEQLSIGVSAGFRRQESLDFDDVRLSIGEFELDSSLEESEAPSLITLPLQLAEILNQSEAHCLHLSDGDRLLGLLLMQVSPLPGLRPSLLAGIGHQVSLRLENARLIEEAALRRSLERELVMARGIQASFLPESMPTIEGWELASAWELAREVGGDFYDVIRLPPGEAGERWGIVIADVADKGIPAALYMALSRTLIRSVAQAHIEPARTLEIVNQQLISDTRADLFVSVFYGILEPVTGKITYANGGHLPPFVFKAGKRAEILREHGMVLGVMPDIEYHALTIQLTPGDLFVLYTDGVSEAQNNDLELFGLQRLESLILALDDWSAEHVAARIVARVNEYSGGRDLSDDLTALTLRYTP